MVQRFLRTRCSSIQFVTVFVAAHFCCFVASSFNVFAEPPSTLYRIDAKSPEGLRQLFQRGGGPLPIVSAHRGGGEMPGYPENCLETFEHTLRHAYAMLEIDLQETADGALVLHHDATLDRTTTGNGPVSDQTLAELKQLFLKDVDGNVTSYRMPTLEETLQWARGKTILIFDKKKVSVERCVQEIQRHQAQSYAMVMAYSIDEIKQCHRLDSDIMMEVMIGNDKRFDQFQQSGVPFDRVVAFVGHQPPTDQALIERLHGERVCCIAGTSRNLDKPLKDLSNQDDPSAKKKTELQSKYQERLDFGVDLIETDLPVEVSTLLGLTDQVPDAKRRFFIPRSEHAPESNHNSHHQLERIQVSDDGTHFVGKDSGAKFRPWGYNFVGEFGQIVEEYWDENWASLEEDFREMKRLGANVVRLHLQVGTYMQSPNEVDHHQLRRLASVLDLADRTGLYLDLTGLGCYHLDQVPDWFAESNERQRWETQANFWEAIAKTCSGHPAVFCYDLINEPVLGPPKDGEHPWLLGELGGQYFVQRISHRGDASSRQDIAAEWVNRMVTAIKKHDSESMITIGVIPWAHVWPNAKPLFYSAPIADQFDFVSVHFYPQTGEVDKAIEALAVYDIGKPLVIEETFPLKCSLDEFDTFIKRSEKITEGWIAHYFGRTIEQHRAGAEPVGPIAAQFLEYWSSAIDTNE